MNKQGSERIGDQLRDELFGINLAMPRYIDQVANLVYILSFVTKILSNLSPARKQKKKKQLDAAAPLSVPAGRRTETEDRAFIHDPAAGSRRGEEAPPRRIGSGRLVSSSHLADQAVGAARPEVATRTGARRPVPDPPQLRHGVRRVPAHAPQPDRRLPLAPASDQRAHRRHSSLPDPPHASQRGAPPPHRSAAGGGPGLHCAAPPSDDLLAMATPASIPRPAEATAIAATISAAVAARSSRSGSGDRGREKGIERARPSCSWPRPGRLALQLSC